MDEAGRGSVFGPVGVGSVIITESIIQKIRDKNFLNENSWIYEINDSKKISAKKRNILYEKIKHYFPFHVSYASPEYIDHYNINNAIHLAIENNIRFWKKRHHIAPSFGFLDGNYRFSYSSDIPPMYSVVKGDAKCLSIAISSIVVKVKRDRLMHRYDAIFPEYMLQKNAGYGTREHLEKIKKNGLTSRHRKTFLKNLKKLNLS